MSEHTVEDCVFSQLGRKFWWWWSILLECDANLYFSFRCAVVVHVALEYQYEQFTLVKHESGCISEQLYEQFTQVKAIYGVLQSSIMEKSASGKNSENWHKYYIWIRFLVSLYSETGGPRLASKLHLIFVLPHTTYYQGLMIQIYWSNVTIIIRKPS